MQLWGLTTRGLPALRVGPMSAVIWLLPSVALALGPECPIGVEVVVDNGDPGYAETGDDWATWGSFGQATGADYRYLSAAVGGPDRRGTATWKPALPAEGWYDVRVTFRGMAERTTDADYRVVDANNKKHTVIVDQTDGAVTEEDAHGPVAVSLGTFFMAPGAGTVTLDGDDDDDSDAADAVIWTLVSCDEAPPPDAGCPTDGDMEVAGYALVDGEGWVTPEAALGQPDKNEAMVSAATKGAPLTITGFHVCDPAGEEVIGAVTVQALARTTGSVTATLEAGGASTVFASADLEWVTVTPSPAGEQWSWTEISNLQATVQANEVVDGEGVAVDAVKVTIEWAPPPEEPPVEDPPVEDPPADDPPDDDPPVENDPPDTPPDGTVDPDPELPPQDCSGSTTTCISDALWELDGCGRMLGLIDPCDDGMPCSIDACLEGGCKHVAQPPAACEECKTNAGKVCHEAVVFWTDTCRAPHAVATGCDDDNPCTADSCDPQTLLCVNSPIDAGECAGCTPRASTACSEGAVVWVDSCGNAGGVARSCNDGDPCTQDACVAGRCVFEAVETNGCEQYCVPRQSKRCIDGVLIWMDSCLEAGPTAESCDDGDPDTLDGCSPQTLRCTHRTAPPISAEEPLAETPTEAAAPPEAGCATGSTPTPWSGALALLLIGLCATLRRCERR